MSGYDLDAVRKASGLASMQALDVIDEHFLDLLTEIAEPLKDAYQHLTDHDVTHTGAVGMLYGMLGAMIEEARGGEGPT